MEDIAGGRGRNEFVYEGGPAEEIRDFFHMGFLVGSDADLTLVLTLGADDVTLAAGLEPGTLRLFETNGDNEFIFDMPTSSLTIRMGLGNDTIVVGDLGTIDCSLSIYGGYGTDSGWIDGSDTVVFPQSNAFNGNDLQAQAETVTVETGVVIDTSGAAGSDAGDITFVGESLDIRDSAGLIATASGAGIPGDITLTAHVTDLSGLSPVDVFPADDVIVHVGACAEISGGVIEITADRTSITGSVLTVVAVQSKTATVDMENAVISGTEVTIEASAADSNLLDTEIGTYFNNYLLSPALNYADLLGALLGSIPVLGTALQAVSVSVRSAESYVTLDGTTITSSGDVTVTTTTEGESAASAGGGIDLTTARRGSSTGSQLVESAPYAVSYAEGNVVAETILIGSATITAGGTVTVGSNASNTTTAESYTAANSTAGTTKQRSNTSVGATSVAVTNSSTTSRTELGEDVVITAGGNADISAVGEVENSADSGVSIFVDGYGGVGLALGIDDADIAAEVNGTVTAVGESTAIALEIANVNPVNDTITIQDHGLRTGDELLYLAADPDDPESALTAIGGLESGVAYRVVVLDEDTIQLVRGETIELDTSATLALNPDSTQSVSRKAHISFEPARAVDVVRNTIILHDRARFLHRAGGGLPGGIRRGRGDRRPRKRRYLRGCCGGCLHHQAGHHRRGRRERHHRNVHPVTETPTMSSTWQGGVPPPAPSPSIPRERMRTPQPPSRTMRSSLRTPTRSPPASPWSIRAGGGTAIDGLVDGGVYYAIVTGTDRIQLAASEGDADGGHRDRSGWGARHRNPPQLRGVPHPPAELPGDGPRVQRGGRGGHGKRHHHLRRGAWPRDGGCGGLHHGPGVFDRNGPESGDPVQPDGQYGLLRPVRCHRRG